VARMLLHLNIENFALVDKLEVDFKTGMNVLTGETGAGKSIIVGAIAQLLGEKADKDDIRSGTKMAVVEGEFDISGLNIIQEILNKSDIESDGNRITLRKEIPINRASRSFINGQMVTLTQLKEISNHLAELFGQHSHQQLLDEKNHQSFLDRFAGLTEEVDKLSEIYRNWQICKKNLNNLVKRRDTDKRERELLLFQRDEIEKARIRAGEEEELLNERRILDSAQLLGEKSGLIINLLDGDDNAVLTSLNVCRKELTNMSGKDQSLESKADLLEQILVNIEDLRTEIEAYMSNIPNDPKRLEDINLRLDEIYLLKKKYGGSEELVLQTLDQIKQQLTTKIDIDDNISLVRNEEENLKNKYYHLAEEISTLRKKAAIELSRKVAEELVRVGMDSAKFEYEFIYEQDPDGLDLNGSKVKPSPEGLETGRFLISANPGEPVKPLARTASGGEISRIMLALKAADKKVHIGHLPLMVFDEIDAGIGGKTAIKVAERLAEASQNAQLLIITHLHQIASVADHHYAVEKVVAKGDSGRKVVKLQELNKSKRKQEIERMISLPGEINV